MRNSTRLRDEAGSAVIGLFVVRMKLSEPGLQILYRRSRRCGRVHAVHRPLVEVVRLFARKAPLPLLLTVKKGRSVE